MKITDIECFVLLVPDLDVEACSSAQDDIVVRVHTDDGIIGIGETDTNPSAVTARIEEAGTDCMGCGLKESDAGMVDVVAAVRDAIGADVTLMVDVAYTWKDYKEALSVLRQLEPYDLYFLETPLPPDDLDGYARLAERSEIRIAAGEWLNSRFEFHDLIDRGRIDVAQPDVGRVRGLTEARRAGRYAHHRSRQILPHP